MLICMCVCVLCVCWNDVFGEGCWNPVFTRPFNDWEVYEAESLLCWLGRYTLDEEGVDKVRWKLSNNGVFTVKSMFKALQLSTFEPFPWQISFFFHLGSSLGKNFDPR